MKNQMTSRDYELISAYLDNQLGSQERALFENRLKTDPILHSELHEIGKTRLLVRSLPKLRAPHNYFVKAEEQARPAIKRPAWRMAPAYGIVSAIATILLVIVIFGDKLLVSPTPVALAPVSALPIDTAVVEERAQSKIAGSDAPTEAAPLVMMGAPAIESTSAPSAELIIGEAANPTPTTIYLYAYPPTSVPESSNDQGTENAIMACEEYLSTGMYPTEAFLYACPSPTGTPSFYLESILPTATPTPTETTTPTVTSTLPEYLQSVPTSSTATPTATPSPTPVPTDTPSPTSSPTPSPTQSPTPLAGVDATRAASAPAGLGAGQDRNGVNPTPTTQVQTTTPPSPSPDVSFVRYVLLAAEVSLAVIAVGAGITAIILRIRAGR